MLSIINIVIILWINIERWEIDWLSKNDKWSLFVARLGSLAALAVGVYIISAFLFAVVMAIGMYFTTLQVDFTYIWAVPLLILLPLLIPLLSNWSNREFRYTSVLINFFEVLAFVRIQITSFRFMLEVFAFVFYVIFNMLITILTLTVFLEETFLLNYIESNQSTVYATISLIHIAVMRIIILPDRNIEQQLIKYKREVSVKLCTPSFNSSFMR